MSVKTILKTISMLIAAAIIFGTSSAAAKAYDNSRDTSQTTASVQDDAEAENDSTVKTDRPVFEDGEILLYCYEQLCLIGSGAPLTDSDYSPDSLGQGENITDENGSQVRYTNDGDYRIACDILLPRHTVWRLPQDFSGGFHSSPSGSRKIYDDLTDTIYIYSAFQQAVMQADDAYSQPVMSGDTCGETFGTGTPVYRDSGGTTLLTYSGEHNYALSPFYDPDVSQVPLSVRKTVSSPLRSGTSLYEGRDFAGQVIKKIDGKAYILIGNQDQLRAIGSDKDVFSPVYQTVLTIHGHELDTDNSGNPIMLYGGDADLLQSQNGNKTYGFQQIDNKENNAIKYYTGVNQNTGEPYLDATHVTLNKNSLTEASWRTGQKYSRDANYIIFRDIDLGGQNSPWKPLMFSGRMYGSKSSSGEKLWDGSGIGDSTEITELAPANRPVISGVYVNQTGKLKINDYIGIGFFATISNLDSTETIGVSAGTSVVKNIELHDVHVENHSTETEVDQTLLNGVTSGLGLLVGTVLDALLSLLSIGSASTDLKTTLTNLLNARAQDPTIFAAGSFAGRIHGEVLIEDCLVSGTVTVSNVKDRTGGFAGYTEGMTEYSGLSTVLGVLTDGLAALLNVIPGVGLGDLITILLGNAIPVRSLIPTNYLVPEIRRCEVSGLTGTVGTDGTSFAGGFVGQQIGTRIENCSVKNSSVSVEAENYGGGFAGLSRDAEIIGTLDTVGIDLSSIIQRIHPQSVLLECTIEDCEYEVTGGSCLGGFIGAMTSSYAIDCTIDGDTLPLNIQGTGSYCGGFAGYAAVGWQSSLGKDENNERSLLGTVRQLVTGLLSSDPSSGQKLLSLMGVSPSAILGCRIYSSQLTVQAGGSYAGGFVGKGDGILLARSDQTAYNELLAWNSASFTASPLDRSLILRKLGSVSSADRNAGGAAGYMGSAAFQGLLNDVVGLGDFIGFRASYISITGVSQGYTVSAGAKYAGGAFGTAVGGTVQTVVLDSVRSVTALSLAGGFAGISGPGELAGTGGLTVNLLGLDRVLEVSGLLSVGQGLEVHISDSTVTGIESGFTVEAEGTGIQGEVAKYKASGFIADSNSTKVTNSHAFRLLSVTADDIHGYAGGFVGTSSTGGLAEAAGEDTAEVKKLIQAESLLSAIGYLIPSYTNCTVNYCDGGYVQADIAGGFAADMESGTVDNSNIAAVDDPNDPCWTKLMEEIYDPEAVEASGDMYKHFAVINIGSVAAKTYGGGFAGKLRSGALADAGGGISILGSSSLGINIGIDDLINVINCYVPVVNCAGVYSQGGFTVTADDVRSDDPCSGSAGGFAGLASGAQISYCDVYRLKHTEVTPPEDLEAVSAPSYFDDELSSYAVTAGHYGGGYCGFADIGSAASVGGGLSVLGNTLSLTNVLSALSVVVTTIEHSDVHGGGGGFSVIADGTDPDDGKTGRAGGFAGAICGAHIQNSHCRNFYYIIGQEEAGGYVGLMSPGNVAKLIEDAKISILSALVDVDGALASVAETFIPTIRNSTTSCVPCGGAVRANSPSDEAHLRGCAGGYCGHNEGGQIWGLNNNTWKDQNEGTVGHYNFGHDREGYYTGTQHRCLAIRIRSVYGYEYAGGFTGLMECADTAETGSIRLLGGLITANNIIKALEATYPTEKNTAVFGPLSRLDWQTWNVWVEYIGKNGGYGAELADGGKVDENEDDPQAVLDAKLSKYIYGINILSGRTSFNNMLTYSGGCAGGYAGLMESGVISNGYSHDIRSVKSMRSAGGFAGCVQTGGLADFGSVSLLGLNLNAGKLISAAKVFVPKISCSSVYGYQSGLTVEATGNDFVNRCGFAGGFAGSVFGAQIWGEDNSYEGCNVYGLRYVRSRIASGGYAGIISAAALADVNTNASDGLLQRIIGTLVQSPDNLASLLQATITTIRQAEITPDNEDFGFYVGGFGDTYPLYAGGFGGSLEAAVINRRKGGPSIEVNGLRRVDGGLYAGGFAGLADVGSLASVSSSGEQSVSVLGLIQAGKTDLLDMFRTYIYDSEVNGIDEGFSVFAHSADSEGMLGETRYSGCAGGFAGGMMNGTIKTSSVTNLNTVSGLNYTGGFIGHSGKNGAVDVDDAAVSGLLGLTAGVLDIFGTVVDNCSVSGIEEGTVIEAEGGAAPDVGGFVGYADVSQIKNSHVTLLKRAVSAKTAGGFAGRTDMHYLIELEASSPLVQIVLKVVNELVKLLYVTDLENMGLVNLDSNLLGLKLLSDGDLLYVNLFGLRIGVSLVRSDTPGVTDTAKITIGDSSVELPCTEDGIDMNNENAEIALNLIKGNRTRIENSSVKGFVRGYDVYGGGADNKHDGTDPEGYAGGFVGYNNEGKLTGNTMTYCDTVSGSPLKTGPFSGTTSLLSVYSFNNILSIEGDGNSYSVYRESDPSLVNLKTSGGQIIGSAAVQDTETPITYNRYDIEYLASPIVSDDSEPYSSIFGKWQGAVMAPSSQQQGEAESVPAEVYKSSSRAVLMLDTPTSENRQSLVPEPAESQDPCDLISFTILKVWDDRDDFDRIRPDSISVRIIQHENNGSGEVTRVFIDEDVIPDADENGWFTLTAADNTVQGTSAWKRVISGLPVYTVYNDTRVYYSYTAEEDVPEGYTSSATYSQDGLTVTFTNTHIPLLPSAGGFGDIPYIIAGAGLILAALVFFGDKRKRRIKKLFRYARGSPPDTT